MPREIPPISEISLRRLSRGRVRPLEKRRELIFQKLGNDVFVGNLSGDRRTHRVDSLPDVDHIIAAIDLVKLGVRAFGNIFLRIDQFDGFARAKTQVAIQERYSNRLHGGVRQVGDDYRVPSDFPHGGLELIKRRLDDRANKGLEFFPAGLGFVTENARQNSFHLLEFFDLFSV